jgi:thiol-disulfide isomerase/thioredoxin
MIRIKYYIAYMFLCSIAIYSSAWAQRKIQPIFNGKICYTNPPDSLFIKTYPMAWRYTDYNYYPIKTNQDSEFSFKFTAIQEPLFISFSTLYNGRGKSISNYFVEPTDNVNINIYSSDGKDSIVFSGVGAEKYNLINALEREYKEYFSKRKALRLINNVDLESELQAYQQLVEKYAFRKKTLINNASAITPKVKEIIDFQFANYYGDWAWLLTRIYVNKKNSLHTKQITRKQYIKFNNGFFQLPTEESMACPNYVSSLIDRIKSNLLFTGSVGTIPFSSYFSEITSKYNGIIRERLLAELFRSDFAMLDIDPIESKAYDNFVSDAKKYLAKSEVLAEALDFKGRFKRGANIYDPIFNKPNGQPFHLSELRGKVVLLKMWGTGCGACITFQHSFEKYIYPQFKDDPRFASVSINVDNEKVRWLKSLNTGKYSNKTGINVYTGGEGMNHSFTKHYNILATPFLLLIDKNGKIYSKLGGYMDMEEINSLIHSAVNDKGI